MLLKASDTDLDIAERLLEEMANTTNFSAFLEAWQNYLYRIARTCEVTRKRLQKFKGFQQWYKPYKRLINKDPLLVYMKQARNAETHSITGTLDRSFKVIISDKIGRPFQLDKVNIEVRDGTLMIDIETLDHFLSYDTKVLPSDVRLVRIVNRGKKFNPPSRHLGNEVREMHPVVAGKMCLDFYRAMITDARATLLINQVPTSTR